MILTKKIELVISAETIVLTILIENYE